MSRPFISIKQFLFLPLTFLLLLPCIQAQGGAEKNYQGRLWAITGNGSPDTSYLYGTIHIMDSKAYQFPEGTRQAFRSVDAYSMELNMDSINPLEMRAQLMMKDSTTIKDLLTDAEYKDVKHFLEDSLGLQMGRFKRMHPMYLLSQVQVQSFERDSSLPLDMYFNKMAKKQGKPVIGLERVSEQTAAFQTVPYDSTAQQLVKVARGKAKSSGGKTSMKEMLDAYVQGDLDKLLKVTKEQNASKGFVKDFLTERNRRMAKRAAKHLKEKTLFIAVGAAHLPGEKGVIELLRKRGFNVFSVSKEG